MTDVVFEGDWSPEEIRLYVERLQRGSAAGGIEALLSDRQTQLIDLYKTAGDAAFTADELPCDVSDPPDWSDVYDLKKSSRYKVRDGVAYRLNENNRWARATPDRVGSGGTQQNIQFGTFRFTPIDGKFGPGVYFPLSPSSLGFVRLRCAMDIKPSELITDEEFYQIETDLTEDIGLMLDARGVKAIVETTGDRASLLMVRDADYIKILGVLSGSGQVPNGSPQYYLVSMDVRGDRLIVDVEMVSEGTDLQKAALKSKSALDGMPLIATGKPPLDRALVRAAVERCRLDGALVDKSVSIELVSGIPDFLPTSTKAFCLPSDGVICLCPFEPASAIQGLIMSLSARLKRAIAADAIEAERAIEIFAIAAKITPQWYLEMLIKRYTGAILMNRLFPVLSVPNVEGLLKIQYIRALELRGAGFWESRKSIADCMAEDFRTIYDPEGLPNLVSLEFDCVVPSVHRMCQHLLLKILEGSGNASTQ